MDPVGHSGYNDITMIRHLNKHCHCDLQTMPETGVKGGEGQGHMLGLNKTSRKVSGAAEIRIG